jgi:hypothetical protein
VAAAAGGGKAAWPAGDEAATSGGQARYARGKHAISQNDFCLVDGRLRFGQAANTLAAPRADPERGGWAATGGLTVAAPGFQVK